MQENTSNLYYSQLVTLVEEFRASYVSGQIRTTDQIATKLNDIIDEFTLTAGGSTFKPSKIDKGDPLLSRLVSSIWRALERNVNIAIYETDLLRASAVLFHNIIATEIEKSKNLNQAAIGRLKTLQLYTSDQDRNLIKFNDSFKDTSLIDLNTTNPRVLSAFINSGGITLPRNSTESVDFKNSTITIIDDLSNGILGNNQEAEDINKTLIDDGGVDAGEETEASNDLVYKAETDPHRDIETIIDDDVSTWLEYESYLLDDKDKEAAQYFNFYYRDQIDDSEAQLIDWSSGPEGGTLELVFEIDLESPREMNMIDITPYGMEGDKNNPINIAAVTVSVDGDNYIQLAPGDLWLGTALSVENARAAEDVVINKAVYNFPKRHVRYIRCYVRQPTPIDANVIHQFYLESHTTPREPDVNFSDYIYTSELTDINSFEVAGSGGETDLPDEWSEVENPANATLTVSRYEAANPYHGEYTARLVNTASDENDYIYRVFSDLKPNTEYVVSAFAWVADFAGPAKEERGILVVDTVDFEVLAKTEITSTHVAREWFFHETTFKTPEAEDEVKDVQVRLYAPEATTNWDAVRFEEAKLISEQPDNYYTERVEGPIPTLNNPQETLFTNYNSDELVSAREVFAGKRWAIGLRDMSAKYSIYDGNLSVFSRSYKVAGLIDRVALSADVTIPEDYPDDEVWVRFFISPNKGITWVPISRIQDEYNELPEVIAFNDPIPEEFQETGVYYYNTSTAVDELKFRIDMSRPADIETSTPIVRSYTLQVKTKQ